MSKLKETINKIENLTNYIDGNYITDEGKEALQTAELDDAADGWKKFNLFQEIAQKALAV